MLDLCSIRGGKVVIGIAITKLLGNFLLLAVARRLHQPHMPLLVPFVGSDDVGQGAVLVEVFRIQHKTRNKISKISSEMRSEKVLFAILLPLFCSLLLHIR